MHSRSLVAGAQTCGLAPPIRCTFLDYVGSYWWREQDPRPPRVFSGLARLGGSSCVVFSGCSFSGIGQCPELLVMMELMILSVPEGTTAASSLLDYFWDDLRV